MINILDIFKSNIYATIILATNVIIIMYLIILSYSIKKIYYYNEEKLNFLKKMIEDIMKSQKEIEYIKQKKQKSKIKKNSSNNNK